MITICEIKNFFKTYLPTTPIQGNYSEYSSIVTTQTSGSSPLFDDYVKEVRKYLRNQTLESAILAKQSFENTLSLQPNHMESHFFHAIARFAALLDLNSSYITGAHSQKVGHL